MRSVYSRLILLAGSLLLALYLLLMVDLAAFHSRALNALWNRAHVGLFFLLTFAFDYTLLRRYAGHPLRWTVMLCLPLVAFAVITEGLQTLTTRQASLEDVWWDLIGISAAILVLITIRYAKQMWHRSVLIAGILLLGGFVLYLPVVLAWADWRNQNDFPVLSNMERFSDHFLWSRGEIVAENATEGQYALKVQLRAELYSGTTLRYMPGDWHGFDTLQLHLFNPQDFALPLSLRIQDKVHDLGEQAHSDRFNHDFNAKPGWTELTIPISKIEKGPRHRAMRIDAITRLRIYARDDKHPDAIFYIDDVRLSKTLN